MNHGEIFLPVPGHLKELRTFRAIMLSAGQGVKEYDTRAIRRAGFAVSAGGYVSGFLRNNPLNPVVSLCQQQDGCSSDQEEITHTEKMQRCVVGQQ